MSGERKEGAGAVGVIPTLGVTDLDRAAAFYERLGFRREWSYPETGRATHLGLSSGSVTVMLVLAEECERPIQRQNLYFVMRDLDGFHRRLAASPGAEVPAIVQADYGMRDFSLADPWGHRLTFGEESRG